MVIHKQFTSYDLKQISKFKTAYSIRFYELLVQFAKTCERYISLDKLRERLELKDLYKRFFDLKKGIIDPSIVEINSTSNLSVDWDTTKKGRVITGLVFLFQKNN